MKKSKIGRMRNFEKVSHVLLAIWTLICVLPFLLLVISSFTKESVILQNGYSFFPKALDLGAYKYLLKHGATIFHAYFITIIVTFLGTTLSIIVTTMIAYALSRNETPMRKIFNFMVFFTMLFNGGFVASYLIWTEWFHIGNTIWALLFPGLMMNGFNIMIMKNYFKTSIHPAIIEAAKIDGAGEMAIFIRIIVPLSTPIIATIGLFSGLAYWNDWQNGLYYINDTNLYSIQYLLNQMIQNISMLSSGMFGSKAAETAGSLPSVTIRMAIAVVGVLPILIVYPFFQKFFAKGIAIGAVKG